jgi:flagellar biogenesis protein FliO
MRGEQANMPLIQLVEVLIVVGVLLWLVNRFIPMQENIKSILNGVVVIAVVLWVLNAFGLFHSLARIHIGT